MKKISTVNSLNYDTYLFIINSLKKYIWIYSNNSDNKYNIIVLTNNIFLDIVFYFIASY